MQVVLAKCLMSLNGHLNWSSFLLFHRVHCGAVSIEKDKNLNQPTVRKFQKFEFLSVRLSTSVTINFSVPMIARIMKPCIVIVLDMLYKHAP